MALFDWLRRGRARAPEPPTAEAAASHARLDAWWATIGRVGPDLLAAFVNPAFGGGPMWPGWRRAFRVVRRGDATILATDGLSDPFLGEPPEVNGLGLELFVETSDIPPSCLGTEEDVAPLARSWAFALLAHVGDLVAGEGEGFAETLDRYGVISIEIPGADEQPALQQLPPGFIIGDGAIGVLIGAPAPDFRALIDDMPLTAVRIVPVVLLRADELEAIRDGGGEARRAIAERLGAAPSRHRSSLSRPSVA
ncbi:hypothetical protein [Brevundimonas sp.]|uniref:hypothetical protein n=1 Tax=Brevundimonas sp. TaxID=1871086 RepID=UPI002C8B24DE|nr:hypothetical protein [Brevundimonas sp.]HWQ87062.1 hypothetical protein [Brevundimonas sp.]